MKTSSAVALGAAWVAGAAMLLAQGAATQPAKPTDERLAPIIKETQSAATPEQAVEAYNRGTNIDRNNVQLNDAYMTRMLQLGQPLVARFPARVLVAHQPNNGLALGVLGYAEAVQGNLAEALADTVCGAEQARSNPGILRNAGQLVAWYDYSPQARNIPAPGRCVLSEIRRSLERQPEYVEAYEQGKQAILNHKQQLEGIQEKVQAQTQDLDKLRNSALDIDAQMRQSFSQANQNTTIMEQLQYYANTYPWLPFNGPQGGDRNYFGYGYKFPYPFLYRNDPLSQQAFRQQYDLEIQRLQSENRQLRGKYDDLQSQGQQVLRDVQTRQRDLAKLQGQYTQAAREQERIFLWVPPAVEGVVTPPSREALRPRFGPVTAEDEAHYRLQLARLFAVNDRPMLAVQTLRDLVRTYRGTSAAQEAMRMLEEMHAPLPAGVRPSNGNNAGGAGANGGIAGR
jgi:hypothetical protein